MIRSWSARMIAADGVAGAPRLRGEFALRAGHGQVSSAVLHVTALGVVEAYVGPERAGDDVLTPGWSAYEWRLRYRTSVVTDQVVRAAAAGDGRAVVGLVLGNGWYRGRLGFLGSRALYGDTLAGLAQLEVTFADGHVQVTGTDESWRSAPSEVLTDDLYDGQTVDARLRDSSWLSAGADLDGWGTVRAVEFDTTRLTPYLGPAVRRQQTVTPQRIWPAPSGRTLVDFGQNLVGWVRLRAQGDPGNVITVRHAEVLEDGELSTRPLRTALATDRFVLSGGPDEFEPTFTFHGFRYAEVEGYPGELTAADLKAVVVHSDLRRLGTFECSDPLVDQLHRNVVWGLRGNVLDVPTDCPQRDERLGWTGDLAVFAPTAAYLYDVAGFLDDWLADLACEQRATGGRVPLVIPDSLKYDPWPDTMPAHETQAIWGDAAVWVPWALWRAYGDRDALARHYPAMAAHARYVAGLLSPSGLWDTGPQLGDWLDPSAPADDPAKAKADPGVVATACYVRTLAEVAQAAAILGRGDDEAQFRALRDRVRAAFGTHYVSGDGLVLSDCPTVYALALVFDVLDPALREPAGRRLAELVEANGYRVATGFAGTPYVLDALTDTGHLDVAYRMLTERACPSWLYPVTMGATTIWERWDSLLPDGSVNPGQMTSFNHYALGAVADWMHRTVAGISPLEPGYRRALIAPRPGGGITWAKASLSTPDGLLSVSWTLAEDGALALDVDVPVGVTALVRRPGHPDVEVDHGHHTFAAPQPPHPRVPAHP